MKLIIFPGAGDPEDECYRMVYDVIKNEALKRNFSEVIIAKYPRHHSCSTNSKLTISSTVEVMLNQVNSIEKTNEEYIIICRSYGCSAFMSSLKLLNGKTNFLRKVIMWGATSYHTWHILGLRDIEKSIKRGKDKGVNIAKDFFKELYPIENSINEIDNIIFPIYFCSGDKDSFYTIEFHNYLRSICKNPNIHFPHLIENEEHEIRNPKQEYFDLIFD